VPTFEDAVESAATPKTVWKLLYDPEQFARWWGCFEAGDTPRSPSHPDFPMPQVIASEQRDGRITVSCMVSDIAFEWRLADLNGGTRIEITVVVPDEYGWRLDAQRDVIGFSIRRLARLAEQEQGVPAPA
jgi:uncharacterized protein YndB with AHSA1/START domain